MPGKPLVGPEGAGNHIWNSPSGKDQKGVDKNAGGANGHVGFWGKRPKWVKGVASLTTKQAQAQGAGGGGNSV